MGVDPEVVVRALTLEALDGVLVNGHSRVAARAQMLPPESKPRKERRLMRRQP